MQRASVMNIANILNSSSTIINILKIEQVIIMWNIINYLTSDNKNLSLQTIDIPVDEKIHCNDIQKSPNLLFKTIDDLEIIEQVITKRNSHHLNQAQDKPLTIESLLSLIWTNTLTSFSQELLYGTSDIATITKYLHNLQQNKDRVSTKTNNKVCKR